MHPAKTSVMLNWPVPNSQKQLQWFLCFVNFYRRFVRDDSSVVAPLTAATSVKKPFLWSPEADAAFQAPKDRFISTPILQMPDPAVQFVVEVDESDIGVCKLEFCRLVGATLSLSRSFYPQSNRQMERLNQDLKGARHCMGSRDPASWSSLLA